MKLVDQNHMLVHQDPLLGQAGTKVSLKQIDQQYIKMVKMGERKRGWDYLASSPYFPLIL